MLIRLAPVMYFAERVGILCARRDENRSKTTSKPCVSLAITAAVVENVTVKLPTIRAGGRSRIYAFRDLRGRILFLRFYLETVRE